MLLDVARSQISLSSIQRGSGLPWRAQITEFQVNKGLLQFVTEREKQLYLFFLIDNLTCVNRLSSYRRRFHPTFSITCWSSGTPKLFLSCNLVRKFAAVAGYDYVCVLCHTVKVTWKTIENTRFFCRDAKKSGAFGFLQIGLETVRRWTHATLHAPELRMWYVCSLLP